MNKPDPKTRRKRRRRTCYDRLHARMITARRVRRLDPASSAAAQLLAIFAALVRRMPLTPLAAAPAPVKYVAPSVSPVWAERKQLAQRLGVPVRYVEITMARGEVPYSVLFHHIRVGGASRRDAMRVLRARAPEASIDWLNHVEVSGRWSDLLLCFVRGEYEEDTDIKLLTSTIAWLGTLSPCGDNAWPEGTGTGMGSSLVPRPSKDSDPTNDEGGPRGRRP